MFLNFQNFRYFILTYLLHRDILLIPCRKHTTISLLKNKIAQITQLGRYLHII